MVLNVATKNLSDFGYGYGSSAVPQRALAPTPYFGPADALGETLRDVTGAGVSSGLPEESERKDKAGHREEDMHMHVVGGGGSSSQLSRRNVGPNQHRDRERPTSAGVSSPSGPSYSNFSTTPAPRPF